MLHRTTRPRRLRADRRLARRVHGGVAWYSAAAGPAARERAPAGGVVVGEKAQPSPHYLCVCGESHGEGGCVRRRIGRDAQESGYERMLMRNGWYWVQRAGRY